VIAYADASALVKRYLAEQGSALVRGWLASPEQIVCCRPGFTEIWRAIGLSGVPDAARLQLDFEVDWADIEVVEVTDPVVRAAGVLAVRHGLRTLDALHLAAAELFAGSDLRVLTWDRRLWRAANARGLATLPTAEP
jgi:predicted nucleic acid-binding protein